MRPISPRPRRRSGFVASLTNSAEDGEQPRVLDDLRRAILSGAEPPGTLIPVDQVAGYFGVSQIPIREALKVLVGECLVSHVPHVGYSVADPTVEELRELYLIREALESFALAIAITRADDAADTAALAAHRACNEATTGGDVRAYHASSRAFHLALMAPAELPRLQHMYEMAWNMTEPTRPMARLPAGERDRLRNDHEQIVQAFLSRDQERLTAESRAHYTHLVEAISAYIVPDPPT